MPRAQKHPQLGQQRLEGDMRPAGWDSAPAELHRMSSHWCQLGSQAPCPVFRDPSIRNHQDSHRSGLPVNLGWGSRQRAWTGSCDHPRGERPRPRMGEELGRVPGRERRGEGKSNILKQAGKVQGEKENSWEPALCKLPSPQACSPCPTMVGIV